MMLEWRELVSTFEEPEGDSETLYIKAYMKAAGNLHCACKDALEAFKTQELQHVEEEKKKAAAEAVGLINDYALGICTVASAKSVILLAGDPKAEVCLESMVMKEFQPFATALQGLDKTKEQIEKMKALSPPSLKELLSYVSSCEEAASLLSSTRMNEDSLNSLKTVTQSLLKSFDDGMLKELSGFDETVHILQGFIKKYGPLADAAKSWQMDPVKARFKGEGIKTDFNAFHDGAGGSFACVGWLCEPPAQEIAGMVMLSGFFIDPDGMELSTVLTFAQKTYQLKEDHLPAKLAKMVQDAKEKEKSDAKKPVKKDKLKDKKEKGTEKKEKGTEKKEKGTEKKEKGSDKSDKKKDKKKEKPAGAAGAGEEESAAAEKKSFFGPETTEHLKGKVQDLKAGGKKAAEKVRDVGGKLWHKTDHWFHQLRGDSAKEGAMTRSWEECHQHALQLYESGVDDNLAWTLEELKTGTLQVYAKSAVIFHHPNDQAAVDELFKSSSGSSQCAAPSTACIAAYCQTPLRTENQRCDVHIFSFSQSFFDISSMDQAKRQVLRDKLKWLCYTVSVCASQHQLSIAWHLPGGAADVSFENDSEVSVEGLQELCKMMMKDQLKAFPEVDLTTRLPDLHSYFDSPGFEETASSTLFVHLGEPWHGAPPLGVFGSCTALTLLCRPTTNPCLNQVLLTAPEDSSLVAPAADVVASAGLDLLDVAEDSAPPMDPMDPVAVVIGDDLELDEELPSEACTSVPNGATGGYPSIEAPAVAQNSSAPVSKTVEEERDWLDELTDSNRPEASAPDAAQSASGAAAPAAPDKAGIVDADFDALWDSMMDDVGEAPKEDVANGA
ncbi:unnamed protein product [Cladocopium goreaui]|uniref:Uncharacterized protein n=1 Tax=Cladocopium goreaui TaxID=2562237 RepID=A0A9P1CJA0_9DINO|nr:unnamed protein product [Cladocopium goreaui]